MKKLSLIFCLILAVAFTCRAQEANQVQEVPVQEAAVQEQEVQDSQVMSEEFMPKGEWQIGGQFGYGNLGNENTEVFLVINPLDFKAAGLIIAPFVTWTYKENRTLGLRVNFMQGQMNLDGMTVDLLTEGLQFYDSDIKGNVRSIGGAIYHRSYYRLDRRGRLGAICEFSLGYTNSRSSFSSDPSVYTNTNKFKLAFSPGLMVFLMKKVSLGLTISMADLYYTSATCMKNGERTGYRNKSGLRMGVDLAGINIAVAFHL